MILSSHEIVRRLEGSGELGFDDIPGADFGDRGRIVIRPYSRTCQQPASYDLRVAEDITLPRLLCTLVPTLEWVKLPVDLAATLRCRSSFGRRGIIITAGFVDPGFRGQLTLCLVNMGSEELKLSKGDRVVQMILHQVSDGQDMYKGRYQDSIGAVHAR
jgi:dCTP deaminase